MKLLHSLGLIFFLGTTGFSALAEETENSLPDDEDVAITEPSAPVAPPPARQRSKAAREGKRGGLALGVGMPIAPLSGSQLHGFYMIKPNLDVGIMIGDGELDLASQLTSSTSVVTKEAKMTATMIGVHSRYFVGNSFYVMGGLGMRTIDASFDFKALGIDYGLKGTTTSKTTVAMLGLGNHWQWDGGFSLGCEWVGYAYAAGATSSASIESYGSAAATVDAATKASLDKTKADAEKLAKDIGEVSTARLLILSAGWTF